MTDSARAASPSTNASELPSEGDSASNAPHALSAIGLGLGVAWVLLPSIQYYAAVQRTALQLEGNAALPGLASWDLTLFYAVLVVCTLILALARCMNSSKRRASGTADGSAADPIMLGEESEL